MRLTQNGALLAETTALKDINFKLMQTLISEGFIGEAAKRHREIFDEVDVSFSVEPEGVQIFQMQYALYLRARQGSAPQVQINLGFRLAFPGGRVFKITVPNLKFSDIGNLENPGRESFSAMTFAAKSDRYVPIF